MGLSLQPKIGAIAGWRIDLDPPPPSRTPAPSVPVRTSFSSSEYRGSVEAVLGSGLDPGRYAVTVEGVTEGQFRDLAKLARDRDPLGARLYLFWVDAQPPTGSSDAGLVAVLRVTGLRRRPGPWRYEVVIEGREWVFDQLMVAKPPVLAVSALDAAQQIAQQCNVVFEPAPEPIASIPPTIDQRTTGRFQLARDSLEQQGDAMVAEAAATGQFRGGLGMYLIRDGKLLLGPDRLDGIGAPVALDATTGLLVVERRGTVPESDGTPLEDETDGPPPPVPRRDVFVATLRGRPDLKPGMAVELLAPELGDPGEELGFALGPGATTAPGQRVQAYVQEVAHRMTREQGFLTVIHCVAAAQGAARAGQSLVERLWFATIESDRAAAAASAEGKLASVLRRVRSTGAASRGADVGQVRALFTSDKDPPPQTETLRRGLVRDGKSFGAGRLDFPAQSEVVQGVPYATPFAWGKFGLVMPRYPGTRVLLLHRDGDPDDPIDVGALWQRGVGPAAQAGDWWLSLPAEVPAAQRQTVEDEQDPPAPSGRATNDLIDADGHRVISVGKLTIRVGDGALLDAGVRPAAANAPVAIEHSSGAKITIDQNGGIAIEAKGALTFRTDQEIVLEGKKITMAVSSQVEIKKK